MYWSKWEFRTGIFSLSTRQTQYAVGFHMQCLRVYTRVENKRMMVGQEVRSVVERLTRIWFTYHELVQSPVSWRRQR